MPLASWEVARTGFLRQVDDTHYASVWQRGDLWVGYCPRDGADLWVRADTAEEAARLLDATLALQEEAS